MKNNIQNVLLVILLIIVVVVGIVGYLLFYQTSSSNKSPTAIPTAAPAGDVANHSETNVEATAIDYPKNHSSGFDIYLVQTMNKTLLLPKPLKPNTTEYWL